DYSMYYADVDGDSYGDINDAIYDCAQPAGYITDNTDCDDTNASINTAASEICNDLDDNCNSLVDDGLTFTNYYADADNDGFGAGNATSSCVDLGAGYVLDNTDCDDTNASVNPAAEEIASNGIDENCDGQIDNSINEHSNAFMLYPNPATTSITLQVNSNLVGKELIIYDAVGKVIHQQKVLSTQTPISLNQMASGNYMLRIGEEVKQFEIIK
ncbi:MAG: MopE-related protein, partial [Bacteroidota bacterium]